MSARQRRVDLFPAVLVGFAGAWREDKGKGEFGETVASATGSIGYRLVDGYPPGRSPRVLWDDLV